MFLSEAEKVAKVDYVPFAIRGSGHSYGSWFLLLSLVILCWLAVTLKWQCDSSVGLGIAFLLWCFPAIILLIFVWTRKKRMKYGWKWIYERFPGYELKGELSTLQNKRTALFWLTVLNYGLTFVFALTMAVLTFYEPFCTNHSSNTSRETAWNAVPAAATSVLVVILVLMIGIWSSYPGRAHEIHGKILHAYRTRNEDARSAGDPTTSVQPQGKKTITINLEQ